MDKTLQEINKQLLTALNDTKDIKIVHMRLDLLERIANIYNAANK